MSRHNAASNIHDLRGIGKRNVCHLIYVPLIAPNTSVYPTAIVSSNHEPINQSYTHGTEAVCNSRKTTLCRSPCTSSNAPAHPATSSNVNNMSKSTPDKLPNNKLPNNKLPNKALKTIKQPRKVLKIAHVNICSLINKVHEVSNLLIRDDMHII
jgi:hypothetical protein